MTTLAEILLAPARRDALVRKTASWIERYVAERSGLRGMALRAGLSAVQAARPDVVPRAVARLLPEFAVALEPLWQRSRASGERDFSAFLRQHADEATAALMAVADARVAASSHHALARGYRGLRGTLEKELAGLLPDVARMIGQSVQSP